MPSLGAASGSTPRLPPVGAQGSRRLRPTGRQGRSGRGALDASGAGTVEGATLDAPTAPDVAEQLGSLGGVVEERSEPETEPPQDQWGVAGWVLRGFAGVGVLDTAYLTAVKLGQVPLVCPSEGGLGCNQVLSSQWASVGPVPLAAVGLAAYVAVAVLSWVSDWTQQRLLYSLCLLMTMTSLVLEAIIIINIHAPCVFCALSAFCSAMLLAIVDAGQQRRDGGSPRRSVLILASTVALGALRVATLPNSWVDNEFYALANRYKPEHQPVRSTSSAAEIALAKHLTAVGAKCYTAWWCPHCQDQREQFGVEAARLAPFVQCSTEERKAKPECKEKRVDGYPTWIIGGKKYGGGQDLAKLARLTNFTDFPEEAFHERSDEALEYIWGKRDEAEP